MSAVVEDNIKDNEDSVKNQETPQEITGTIMEGNVPSIESNKIKTHVIGATSENNPQSLAKTILKLVNKESGDMNKDLLTEKLVKYDGTESQMAEQLKVPSVSEVNRGSGDFVATSISDETAISSKNITKAGEALDSGVTDKNDKNNDSSFDKCDEIDIKKADIDMDQTDEAEDTDDMQLRWDDDDGSDNVVKNNDNLTEEQLLEESLHNLDASKNAQDIETNLDSDILNENSTKMEIFTEKGNVISDNSINSELLKETDLNAESTQISNENIVDNSSKNEVLKELEIDIDISQDNLNNISTTEKETEQWPMALQKADNSAMDDGLTEDELLAEPENSVDKALESAKDFTVTENADDLTTEEKLLEETEVIQETDVSMEGGKDDLDKNKEILLENKVLQDIETNVKINIPLETEDAKKDEELLKDDESQYDSCTAMEVDNTFDCTDECIGHETEGEKKDMNETIEDQAKVTKKDNQLPTDHQSAALDINREESNVEVVVDKDKVDQPIDDQNREKALEIGEDTNKPKQTVASTIDTMTESNKSDVLIAVLQKTPEKEVEIRLEPIESTNQDNTLNTSISEETAVNTSTKLEDSLIDIKTDHGLHKPDVMLEIPTQELIDMDDTDLSINLDNSKDEDIIQESTVDEEKTVDQEAIVTAPAVDQVNTEDGNTVLEQNKVDDNRIRDLVVQETIEESLERMFADDEAAIPKEVVECITTTSQITDPPKAIPSTCTKMTPDTSDEVPEVSDSLGLLAESAGRLMEDDEDDDVDDDDDFDQDESSNQISAEQSEDSNPAALEAETVVEEEKELDTPDPKDEQFQYMICDLDAPDKEEEKMEIQIEAFGTVELQAETINDEAKTAVDALLKNSDEATTEAVEDPQDTDQMDIETVKLSDTSDNEVEVGSTQVDDIETTKPSQDVIEEQQDTSKQTPSKQSPVKQLAEKSRCKQSPAKQSPSKMSKLEITPMEANKVVNIVDLEESSSSEDDIQVVAKEPEPEPPLQEKSPSPSPDGVTNVNIPTSIDIMCTSGGNTSAIVTKDGETVISGIPKAPPHRPARLNTSEVSIKTASNTEPLVIPETKINENGQTETQTKPKLGLEIFSLDSDDDESAAKEQPVVTSPQKMTALELEKARETSKCINYCCTSGSDVPYKVADMTTVAYYDAGRKRRSMVCQPCADVVANRTKKLMEGIKNFSPLLDLDMAKLSQDLVEISDSESEDEEVCPEEPKETIGEKGAKLIEENLAQLLNETWHKYDMDTRLKETQIMLDDEIEKLEQDSKEIDAMLNECQVATDKLRSDLYAAFTYQKQELQPITLYDTPNYKYFGPETDPNTPNFESQEPRKSKRRLSSTSETPAKRPAIPLGYAPLDVHANKQPKPINAVIENRIDDDKDISVVKLSAEAAPAGLPPPGEISHPPLRVGMPVFAMKNAFGPWLKGRVLEIQPKVASMTPQFTLCRVKFDHKTKTNGKILPARCLAYAEPADVRMTIGTRLIALFKDANKRESYYSGVVAEIPNPVNNYRYLVFFDDGYAQYVQHAYTRVVCESSSLVWEEVHPFSRDFVREYLMTYPERPMVRLHEGQHLKTEWNGKWWSSRVIRVDASLAQVMFVGDGRREWIYRGSTRLAPLYLELRAAERHRPRPMPRSKAQPRSNMPYVEYTRSDEPETPKETDVQPQQQQQQQFEEIRRQRAVAKKSTSVPAPPPPQQPVTGSLDTVTSRVVYYTPKNAVKPYKMTPHRCGPKCKRNDVLSLKELRTYNPLAKPLLSGWERQIVRFKGHKEVMYRAPCGRRVRSMRELHKYLLSTDSELPVDLFDFHYATHCLAEFVLNKCRVGKKDLSHGKENVPVPCVNYYDDSLPEFCSYNTERTPTAGVPLNLDPEFLCGCDCTDDCQDKSKCACWKMTLEGARTIGLHGPNLGYVYKRLPEPLPSGIYECNSRCKCKHTCLNRVAQHPLQLKLQVFKTLNRGWGIRALNDVPKGSFLCVYAGNLLTDATANLDGLNEGDEYLAELDYIEVVEQMKEGYEEDIPEADKKLDKKDQKKDGEDTDDPEPSSSEDEEAASKTDKEDDDFRPGYVGLGDAGNNEFSKRLRRRERSKKAKDDTGDEKDKEKEKDKDTKEANAEEDCITISDDEEVREPSRFTVQAGMGANEFISKYKSVRTLFGKDEACYIMDAKVQGNIGRYLNHSCCPNVFVQNVFVDTHDPRFPWVAFFALSHIKAGTELTWNYNYDVGSVPGKVLYCYCGAPNCRGRLL